MDGKNIWRPCKTYGCLIGYPTLKPHDLRHGVAMEILAAQHDLEAVRAMLGHVRRETTLIYAQIRPAQLKRAVEFYEAKALDARGSSRATDTDRRVVFESASAMSSNTKRENINENKMVAPTGFDAFGTLPIIGDIRVDRISAARVQRGRLQGPLRTDSRASRRRC